MVDIHSHVLYGLDDGAETLEDSLAMVRMASEHGTTDLVATPHANTNYKFDPARNADLLAEIQSQAGVPLKLHLGCDFHLSYDNIEDSVVHPTKYTIAQRNYLLVEFSDLIIFKNTPDIFNRLSGAGMIPIVTHPERNSLLRQRIKDIAAWVQDGTRVQVTAQSVTGDFGRRAQDFSKELLDLGLVHVIASDAHDLKHRPPVMSKAREWLTENYSEALSHLLCVENPSAALAGTPMKMPERNASGAGRKWYEFWR